MLEYRPGYSSSCLPLDVNKPHPSATNKWSYIDVNSIAATAYDQLAGGATDLQNGVPHASTSGGCSSFSEPHQSPITGLKRSASPENALLDTAQPNNAKKARIGVHTAFKRVLTHTFKLQPYHSNATKTDLTDAKHCEPSPDTLQADLTAFPSIKCAGHEVACLSTVDLAQSYGVMHYKMGEDILTSICLLYAHTDIVRLKGGRMRKVGGKAKDIEEDLFKKEIWLDFHYTLEVEIHLDLSNLRNVDTDGIPKLLAGRIRAAIAGMVWRSFLMERNPETTIGPIEARSGSPYKETNLEWFYSCLPRPPAAGTYHQQDHKGKGRADDDYLEIDSITGSIPIEASGLIPRLHPFQCRSLEWMLYREGKTIAGRNEDGKHVVQTIRNPCQLSQLYRSAIWHKVKFDDGHDWWFCPTSVEFSEIDPAGNNDPGAFEGSILAEEMGLGKTVEILSLILLNREPERNNLPSYDADWLAADVRPSNLTLLVCPLAIIGQWQDEISRHAPSLRVLRYSGMKTTYPKDDGKEVERTIRKFDIVICDFDTMAKDLAIARKPRLHLTRGQIARGNRVSYRRSVLVGIEWLRVVLDEAQMAASTTSTISETASWIPRKYSWAVSGTPIKQTTKDLAGLLKFLRVYNVGDKQSSFQKLLEPELADVFTTLISRIGIRTVKSQIERELSLPAQERFIVPVNFAPIELYNYRAKYGDALTELQLHMDASRLVDDWTMNRALMSRWLHALRQACFYAQAGAPERGANHGRKQEELMIQTLDDILLDLRGKNISELHTDQRYAAMAKVDRAYRIMYDKEDCERYERGLKILGFAKRDLHLLAQDIFNELVMILPEARASTPDSRADSITPTPELAAYPYLTVFKDKVREVMDSRNAQDSTVKAKNQTRLITVLTGRLRDALFIMHKAVFFIGNAYFGMGNKEEAETAAYAEADALRKQILHADEAEARKEVHRLEIRLQEKRIKEEDVLFAMSESKGGLQSRNAFEDIAILSEAANKTAGLMLRWRQFIIESLSSNLTEAEISDTEYQTKAEAQEQLDIYIEYLGRIQADWIQIITGTKSTLADNPTTGGGANSAQTPTVEIGTLELANVQDNTGISSRSKRKREMNRNNTKVTIAAADPATKLRRALASERKKVVPSFMLKKKKQLRTATRGRDNDDDEDDDTDEDDFAADTSLRERLRQLQRLKENVLREEEERIIAAESSRLRKELHEKDRVIEKLRTEQNVFADVYNARVRYYRVMQEFGDSVAVLPDTEATPGALRAEIERLNQREVELDHQMLAKIARRRYLDSLKDANLAEEGCLICANTETGQMVLTHCGHCMHEKCLRTWCLRSGQRTCPVCRASLERAKAWRKIHVEGASETIDEKASAETNGGSLAVNGSGRGRRLPTVDTSDMQNDGAEDENLDDPATQLNFLPAEEVENIVDMPLAGASLGSKLDAIVKHVKLLRDRHRVAIERYDNRLSGSQEPQNDPAIAHSGSKITVQDTEPPSEAKVLIYSAWQYACDVLAAAFRREKIRFVRLEAGTTHVKKEKAPLEFKEDPECTVFILHAKSQAAGLTLTAASYVILVEPLLEPALETQAIARVHRIGQRRKTTVFQYIIPDTVDERIALLSLRKWKHNIFSRAHSTGTVQESTISTTIDDERDTRKQSSRHSTENGYSKKERSLDGDSLTDEDLARLVLDKDGMARLNNVRQQVASIQDERRARLAEVRSERHRLGLEIMQAAREDPTLARDWDGWDIGEEVEYSMVLH